ncbi:hypothetical protein A3K64_03580 [Candidatus Micrarchaeota archaeon RBG_16_36_9]|nr:MAG: hypothetical protein A3K64_03580 [Candidatus Micrarchaeota archaeon RBG_16_36_9]
MKKLLSIPILIFVYIFLVNSISGMNFSPTIISETTQSGSGEVLNIGQNVGVSVTRPYFFGLITLPVYVEGLGNIGICHDAFFTFIFILAVALIIIEVRSRKRIKVSKTKRKGR